MNVAYTAKGKFVEVQGSAENGTGFHRSGTLEMLDLAAEGCRQILSQMRR
jgi:ribonuclease PH